jgi:enoyl-[acyl-carrier protein] reductase III
MEDSRFLKGKIALVTGGSRGIGRAVAERLAGAGADVVVNYFRNREAAEEVVSVLQTRGVRAWAIRAHIGDPEEVARLITDVEIRCGGLDVVVSNAASGVLRPVTELEPKHWDWTMNINARGLLCLAKHAAPVMKRRGGGTIVAISSLGSIRALENYAAVGASKAALEAVTRYLAVELAQDGIVVNAVSAGAVDTDALRHFPNREELLRDSLERTPAGRLVEPADIAGVVLFLCSPQASMVRGQTVIVDGGLSLLL